MPKPFYSLLMLVVAVASFPAVASRSIDIPPMGWLHIFRIDSAKPLIAAPPGMGFVDKWVKVTLHNNSTATQTGNVKCDLHGGFIKNSSAVFGTSYLLGDPNQATGNALADSAGDATRTVSFSLSAGQTTQLSCRIGYYGPALAGNLAPAVSIEGTLDIGILVNEDAGALTGEVSETTSCNGGCFATTAGTTTNENLVLATETSTAAARFPILAGHAF